MLHFSLRLRGADASAGAADREFAAGDATTSRSDDGGVPPGQVGIDLTAPAVAAKCGDYLVLKITMVSGGSPYLEFFATLDLP